MDAVSLPLPEPIPFIWNVFEFDDSPVQAGGDWVLYSQALSASEALEYQNDVRAIGKKVRIEREATFKFP